MTQSADVRIADIAAQQDGLCTSEQAEKAGATPTMIAWRVRSGRWECVHARVYRITGAPVTWRQHVRAALLACGPSAAASHRTAAALHGLEGFGERYVEVIVPQGRARKLDGSTVRESRSMGAVDFTVGSGLRVTAVPRTLIDLAALLSPAELEDVAEDALRRRLTTPAKIRAACERLLTKGRPGSGRMRDLLARRDPAQAPTDSTLENGLGRVLRRCRLPVPRRQERAGRAGRIDFAYPVYRIAIEMESDRWHEGPSRVRKGARKQNRLVLGRWTVLRFTWEDVDDTPDEVCSDVREALQMAGWRNSDR